MNFRIDNGILSAEISSIGGELRSLKSADGTEYLWQGDPRYWTGHAPNLFPYIGRFTDGKYTFGGHTYEMTRHGFIRNTPMQLCEQSDTKLAFGYCDCARTLAMYPFRFRYRIEYTLEASSLFIAYIVENMDDKTIYFGAGGHPAFNVPIESGRGFEDYRIQLEPGVQPTAILLTSNALAGNEVPYTGLTDSAIPLKHSLFDDDAIILHNAGASARICADSGRAVTVRFPDMPYVGFWHMPHTDAHYVCIEPWSSLCSRDGIVEDFATQPSLVSLGAGGVWTNRWSIEIE